MVRAAQLVGSLALVIIQRRFGRACGGIRAGNEPMLLEDTKGGNLHCAVRKNATEWGIASLVFGAVLFLAAPITLLVSVDVWAQADRTPGVVLLHAWLARIAVSLVLLTGAIGVGCGIAGVRTRTHQSGTSRLAVAGLMLSVIAFTIWLITSICLLNTTESLLLLFGAKR